MKWDRIEMMGRSLDLTEGVQARLADPFWMIGRQWQVGEFRGDDAARPVAVEFTVETYPVTRFRADGGAATPADWPRSQLGGPRPLSSLAESVAVEDNGLSGMRHAAQMGQKLVEMLRNAGAVKLATWVVEKSKFDEAQLSQSVPPSAQAALRLIVRRGVDARRLFSDLQSAFTSKINKLPSGKADKIKETYAQWEREMQPQTQQAWNPQRLEYQFSLGVQTPDGEVTLRAPEYHGQGLDWFHFDVAEGEDQLPAPEEQALPSGKAETRSAIPTSVTYTGMPASGWWQIEDKSVHMGDIQSGPGDFARLMVAEFATVYSDDWFMIPIRVPRGSLTRITSLKVHDNFSDYVAPAEEISHVALVDEKDPRPFRLFELSGDPSAAKEVAPWLFVPPAMALAASGPVVERVEFARDEGANLAWAVERMVEGPLGRSMDRGRAWTAAGNGRTGPAAPNSWAYHVAADTPPPWWIPLVPVKVRQGHADTWLRRGRMANWQQGGTALTGPLGSLLAPVDAPFFLAEEEVPRSGVTVTRQWQYARGVDGAPHIWMRHAKSSGRQETSSGLRWDILKPDGPANE